MNYLKAAIGIVGILALIAGFLAALWMIVLPEKPPILLLRMMAGGFLLSIGSAIPTVMYIVRVRGSR